MTLIEDVCASLAATGFRRIVFLNGHCDNTYAIAYACASAAERMPRGVRAYPVNYWDGMTSAEAAEYFDPTNGLHANRGETSAVLAIDPDPVDMEQANDEMPAFPEVTSAAPVHTAGANPDTVSIGESPGNAFPVTGDSRAPLSTFRL